MEKLEVMVSIDDDIEPLVKLSVDNNNDCWGDGVRKAVVGDIYVYLVIDSTRL